jgi:hypothetical protein
MDDVADAFEIIDGQAPQTALLFVRYSTAERHAVCSGDLLALDPSALLALALEVETDGPSLIVLDRLLEFRFREVKILLVDFDEGRLERQIGLAPCVELRPGDAGGLARRRDVARLSIECDEEQLLPAVRLRRLRVAAGLISAAHALAPIAIAAAFCRRACLASDRARPVPCGHTSHGLMTRSLLRAGEIRSRRHALSLSRNLHFIAA